VRLHAANIPLGRTVGLALLLICLGPVYAAKNSPPAQVTMVATMPATFSLQAGQSTIVGATGTVQVQSTGRGVLLVRGHLLNRGGRAILRIPLALAANTRSFVVQANMQDGNGRGTAYLTAPEIMARRMPMRGQTFLAMAVARNHGREFFVLDHPLRSTLEIVFTELPSTQSGRFSLTLNMRELGY